MKIVSLVENTTNSGMKVVHGLSLYIEIKNKKILFDLGPDDTFVENAKALNIDIKSVDILIISHGHHDHGGALKLFLEINKTAKVYVQRRAFQKHFSIASGSLKEIGIDEKFINHPQVILLDGDFEIDENLKLFTTQNRSKCYSTANDVLFENDKQDEFLHEQNLIIKEEKTALVMGCGHCGVVNIMEKASLYNPEICVGGYHFSGSSSKCFMSDEQLFEIAEILSKYKTKFYTCHCTGVKAFEKLKKVASNIEYLACGDVIEYEL